jgi:NADH dehydrogenase
MDISGVCIFAGSGFVGSAIAEQACARGFRVRVVTRNRQRARDLLVLPTIEVAVADPNDERELARCLDDMDAAVNLVGILHEVGGATFESAHVELPRKLARACRSAGVQRLLHMSALGASASGPSQYLRSKAAGEEAAWDAGPEAAVTIFRPSVIFGEHDRFLNKFAQLARFLPALLLPGGESRAQPVWVEDVARCFVAALEDSRTFGRAYELGGPRAYSYKELMRFVCATLGRRRWIMSSPPPLAELQAFAFGVLPGKLITSDNLRSMSIDNVCADPFPAVFGFAPSHLEALAPAWLGLKGPRARYERYRHYAGR